MLHIFWDCSKIRLLCQEVASTIKHLTDVNLAGNLTACLLQLMEGPIKKYKTSLTIQLLNDQ